MAQWTPAPLGLDALTRATLAPERTVLVAVHHSTAGTRLADVIPLIERDQRVQLLFSAVPGSQFAHSAHDFLRYLDGVTVPWTQATAHRFDLAVAANLGGMEAVHAPVLSLDHGSGPGKIAPRAEGDGAAAPRTIAGIASGGLVHYGRVIPSVIGLAHERHRTPLAREVPSAEPAARVVGNPSYDRILASVGYREQYRLALGVEEHQTLVVVSSTYGRNSLLGGLPDLPRRIAAALPNTSYRVVVVPHPFVWEWHGRRQVRAWLDDAQRHGAILLPPEDGWQAALIASDLVIGDHGSVTYTAAALGPPVLMGAFSREEVNPGSHVELLVRAAPYLDPESPIEPQIRAVLHTHSPDRSDWYSGLLTSAPGESARLLRAVMYELMGLPEPDTPPRVEPVPLPRTLPRLGGGPL